MQLRVPDSRGARSCPCRVSCDPTLTPGDTLNILGADELGSVLGKGMATRWEVSAERLVGAGVPGLCVFLGVAPARGRGGTSQEACVLTQPWSWPP